MMGMLVSMALGDSYGACFEYVAPGVVKLNNDLKYRQHPSHTELLPGQYTDGVQMAVALAHLLLSDAARTPLAWADCLVDTFKANPRVGYAKGFHEFLTMIDPDRGGEEFLKLIEPHSDKSGAAERAVVCGFLGREQEVIDTAMWQASLTHATKDGMASAAASALMVWACRHGFDLDCIAPLLTEQLPGYPWETPWQGHVNGKGVSAVRAALTAIQSGFKLSTILKAAVAFSGDVDGVAGIAMAAASLHPDIENNLPKSLTNSLENGPWGHDFLRELDGQLEDAFPVSYDTPEPEAVSDAQADVLNEFFDFDGGDARAEDTGWFIDKPKNGDG